MNTKTIFHPVYGRMVDNLKAARNQKGLTQEQAGHALNKSRNWIHKMEQKELRMDVLQLVGLCRVYGRASVDVVKQIEEELFREDDGSSSHINK